MKLRNKLIILLIISSCFVSTPVLYITYQNVSEKALEAQIFYVDMLLENEFRNITDEYINNLNSKVEEVISRKNIILQYVKTLESGIDIMLSEKDIKANKKEQFILSFLNNSNNSSVHSALVVVNQEIESEEILSFVDTKEKDIKGRTFEELLNPDNLNIKGEFASFSFDRNGIKENILFYFFPVSTEVLQKSGVIISYMTINDFQESERKAIENIVANVQKRFDDINLLENSFIALVDDENNLLASSGRLYDMELFEQILEISRTTDAVSKENLEIGGEEYLVQTGYLKALGWSMLLADSYTSLKAPGKDLVTTLLTYCIIAFALALFVSLLMLGKIIKPLVELTDKVKNLRKLDISCTKEIKKFAESLPTESNDEIGLLTNNFKLLTNELSMQISNLIDTTTIKERMQGELDAARDIQMDILDSPENAPNNDEIISAFYLQPAKEVGGDLYEYIKLENGKYALIVGDVSGKGVPAALFMSMTVTLIRYAFSVESNIVKAVENINTMLAAHNESNMFVTLLIALYDPSSRQIEYVNCGHCQPYIVNQKTKNVRRIEAISGPIVGVFEDIEYPSFIENLEKDETFIAFSDGITEAMNEENSLYSEERLVDFLKEEGHLLPKDLIANLYRSVLSFRESAPASDDITMFAFCVSGDEKSE